MDFERDDLIGALAAHGYRTDARTFFIWEGVTQYLTEDAVRATLDVARRPQLRAARLAFTYVRQDFIDGRNMYGARPLYRRFRQRRQVWKFGLVPDDVAAFVGRIRLAADRTGRTGLLPEHYIRPTGRDLTASRSNGRPTPRSELSTSQISSTVGTIIG